MFEWKEEYAIQVQSVDAQHRVLFQIAAELHSAMAAGRANDILAGILERLIQYSVRHFADEERLLRSHGYPELAGHNRQHEAFTAQIHKFQADFQSGRITVTIQLLQFLKDWLVKHICQTDREYVPYVTGRKPSPVLAGR